MKKNYFFILSVLACLSNVSAQNLWGVDASIDVPNAEFQNDFIETGTAGNYSTSDWTALSISDNAGTVTPGAAFWTRNTIGYSQGGYAAFLPTTNSPSQANGIAIFDSDFMDNNGTAGAFGTGSSPAAHKGELISPRIDLTGNTDVPLAVKFFRYFRLYQITELSVSFSSDDGATWGNPVDYIDGVSTNMSSPDSFKTLLLPTNATQGISNLSQCRIKFTFDGYYYFSIIDDITIFNANSLSTSDFTFKTKIALYPNPSKHVIHISGLTKNENYTIYNILGTEISKGIISNKEEIQITNYANGFYLLKLENGNTFKFIKE